MNRKDSRRRGNRIANGTPRRDLLQLPSVLLALVLALAQPQVVPAEELAAGDAHGVAVADGISAPATAGHMPAPTVLPPTTTNVNSFVAAWTTVSEATGYELDVASTETFLLPGDKAITNGFEGAYPPAGWTETDTEPSATYAHAGTYSARITAAADELVTPLLPRPGTLTVWTYTTSSDPDILLQYATNRTGPWSSLPGSPFFGDTDQWMERQIDLAAFTNIHVRFQKNGTGNLYLDDVHVTDLSNGDFVGGYQARAIAGGATASFSVTGLLSHTAYFYRVRASNSTSSSASSATQSVSTLRMPAPVSLAGSNPGASSFEANWHTVPAATGYRLDASTNRVFATFQPGFADRDVGHVSAYTVTGLTANISYFYRVRAYDAGSTSAHSATQQVDTALKPEPTQHATGFTVGLATHRTIVLDWADATGGVLPDGYLVRGSIHGFADIPVPADGTTVGNSYTWNSGRYAHTIAPGTQTDQIRGLAPETTYFFKLFPVTNSGADSCYKTDGTVPQLQVTTTSAPFEDFEGASKPGYAAGTVALGSGTWELEEALLGGTLTDRKADALSARIRNQGSISMRFDVAGVGTLTLQHALFGTDTGGRFVVEVSVDQGATWQQAGNEVAPTATLQDASFRIHRPNLVRIRIRKTMLADDENRLNIDNIRFSPFQPEPTLFRFR